MKLYNSFSFGNKSGRWDTPFAMKKPRENHTVLAEKDVDNMIRAQYK